MPTLTSTQGALVAGCTPNDTIAVTVNSGAYSLEYPLGTLLASASTTSATYSLGAGQYRLTTTGNVTYTLTADPDAGSAAVSYDQASGQLFANGAQVVAGNVTLSLLSADQSIASTNYATIQAALDAGGTVQIVKPGDYYVSDGTASTDSTFVMRSNTTFIIGSGVRILRPTGVGSKSWISNTNMRSPRKKVTAISSVAAGLQPNAFIVTFAAAGHTLTAGSYALVRGEGSGFYNGIFNVLAVVPGVSFDVYFSGANPMPAAGSLTNCHSWPADANIKVIGDGVFDSQYIGGTIGTQRCGLVFNKVRNLELSVSVLNSLKYHTWTANIWDGDYTTGKSASINSDGIHLCGPQVRPTVREWRGGSTSDDTIIFANDDAPYFGYQSLTNIFSITDSDTIPIVSTSNNGGLIRVVTATAHGLATGDLVDQTGVSGSPNANYNFAVTVINSTTYDCQGSTYDSNGTGGVMAFKTSHGNIERAEMKGLGTDRALNRRMLFWGSRGYTVQVNVQDVRLSNATPAGNALMQFSVPGTQSASFDLTFKNCQVAAGTRNIIQNNAGEVGIPATISALKITMNGFYVRAEGAYTNGNQGDLIALVSNIATTSGAITQADINLTDVEVPFDVSGSTNYAMVSANGPVTQLDVVGTGLRMNATGTARTAHIILGGSSNTGVINASLSNMRIKGGGQVCIANFSNTGATSVLEASNFHITGGSNSTLAVLGGPTTNDAHFSAYKMDGSFAGALNLFNARTFNISSRGGISSGNNFIYALTAASTINLYGIDGNWNSVVNPSSATSARTVRLKADLTCIGGGMDADKLATSGHAPGVKVYNTNATPDATSQTLGFPASSAIGAYVLGASTFTRVAS